MHAGFARITRGRRTAAMVAELVPELHGKWNAFDESGAGADPNRLFPQYGLRFVRYMPSFAHDNCHR